MGKEHHVPSVGNHSQGCKKDGDGVSDS
jgi:hypothetical protein